jgi:hypothetical protein
LKFLSSKKTNCLQANSDDAAVSGTSKNNKELKRRKDKKETSTCGASFNGLSAKYAYRERNIA